MDKEEYEQTWIINKETKKDKLKKRRKKTGGLNEKITKGIKRDGLYKEKQRLIK